MPAPSICRVAPHHRGAVCVLTHFHKNIHRPERSLVAKTTKHEVATGKQEKVPHELEFRNTFPCINFI